MSLFTDGLSKKKKRKLSSVGNVYSGVSVSQLIAQRERAIAVASATGIQSLPSSNGSQVILLIIFIVSNFLCLCFDN